MSTPATNLTGQPIQNRAMLVKLGIRKWTPTTGDEKATEIIETSAVVAQAVPDRETEETNGDGKRKRRKAGKFKKWLIDTDHILWKNIANAEGRARKAHNVLTLMWALEGAGVLPAPFIDGYIRTMQTIRDQFWAAVSEFMIALPSLKDERRKEIPGLYKEEDYPDASEMLKKFRFEWDIFPLPAQQLSDGLMAQLSEEQQAEVALRTGTGTTNVSETMTDDMLRRVVETVGAMAERLSDPENIFRDSLVQNVRDLHQMLGDLNVIDNPEIEALRDQIIVNLDREPAELRNNPELRAEVAIAATEIAYSARRKIKIATPPKIEVPEPATAIEESVAVAEPTPEPSLSEFDTVEYAGFPLNTAGAAELLPSELGAALTHFAERAQEVNETFGVSPDPVVTETAPGEINIACGTCGQPLTHSNEDGMFCDNECGREASRAARPIVEDLVSSLAGMMGRGRPSQMPSEVSSFIAEGRARIAAGDVPAGIPVEEIEAALDETERIYTRPVAAEDLDPEDAAEIYGSSIQDADSEATELAASDTGQPGLFQF